MNIQKFTQKSVQAVNELEKIAMEYGNQEKPLTIVKSSPMNMEIRRSSRNTF